ncbi:MAG: hypothetical protein WAM39_25835 [Bryobacteraceae bacterium]
MKLALSFAIAWMTAPLIFAQSKGGVFEGEIMDKQCAQMQSHENMMNAEHAGTSKECTLACVKNGDSFALLDSTTKKVYPIEDGKKAKEFAGQQVRITGSYDSDSETLHIKTISLAGK